MTSLRRSIPILDRGLRSLASRSFHETSHFNAKAKPSPRININASSKIRTQSAPKTYYAQDSLPPLAILQSATKSGAMDLEPSKAMEFLTQFVETSRSGTGNWAEGLCTVHGVTPTNMVLLSGILRRCPSQAQQSLAKGLAMSASELGEKTATFELIQSGINTGRLHEYQAPLRRLGLLAKKDNDLEAMALLGKVLFSQQKHDEALQWFQKATKPPTGNLDFAGSGDALVYEGRILSKKGDKKGAEESFKKAALELDEPLGYFHLSQTQEPGSSTQEIYLMKAAASGILEAMHNLGVLELEKLKKEGKKPASLNDYGMAREWLQVAAADGFGASMLNMALMCRSVGEEENGLTWLDSAEKVPGVEKEATKLRREWAGQKTRAV